MKTLLLPLLLVITVFHDSACRKECVLSQTDYVEFRYRGGDFVKPDGTKSECIMRDNRARGSYCSNYGTRCPSSTLGQIAINPDTLQPLSYVEEWLSRQVICMAVKYTRATGTLNYDGTQGSGCSDNIRSGLSIYYEAHIPEQCQCRYFRRTYY